MDMIVAVDMVVNASDRGITLYVTFEGMRTDVRQLLPYGGNSNFNLFQNLYDRYENSPWIIITTARVSSNFRLTFSSARALLEA